MANTMFASAEQLLEHLVTPLPLSKKAADEVFRDFQDFGYIARQERTGISTSPKGMAPNIYLTAAEGVADAYGQTQVVMLSHPTLPDSEFDEWVSVVRNWSAALPPAGKVAISRKINYTKKVSDGVPLSLLSDGMPSGILLSYARQGDFVIVIDLPKAGKRRIYATKNIG